MIIILIMFFSLAPKTQAGFQISQLEKADENLMKSVNCYKNDDSGKLEDDIPLDDEELRKFELVLQYKTIRTQNVEDVLMWLLKNKMTIDNLKFYHVFTKKNMYGGFELISVPEGTIFFRKEIKWLDLLSGDFKPLLFKLGLLIQREKNIKEMPGWKYEWLQVSSWFEYSEHHNYELYFKTPEEFKHDNKQFQRMAEGLKFITPIIETKPSDLCETVSLIKLPHERLCKKYEPFLTDEALPVNIKEETKKFLSKSIKIKERLK